MMTAGGFEKVSGTCQETFFRFTAAQAVELVVRQRTTLHCLHVGGLIAMGFDPSGEYLLTISHAGRGVFSTRTWERVARDSALAYPADGHGVGIGPIAGVP